VPAFGLARVISIGHGVWKGCPAACRPAPGVACHANRSRSMPPDAARRRSPGPIRGSSMQRDRAGPRGLGWLPPASPRDDGPAGERGVLAPPVPPARNVILALVARTQIWRCVMGATVPGRPSAWVLGMRCAPPRMTLCGRILLRKTPVPPNPAPWGEGARRGGAVACGAAQSRSSRSRRQTRRHASPAAPTRVGIGATSVASAAASTATISSTLSVSALPSAKLTVMYSRPGQKVQMLDEGWKAPT